MVLQKLGIPDSVIPLIHNCMKSQIHVNGDLLEGIDVDNGLREDAQWPLLYSTSTPVWWQRDGTRGLQVQRGWGLYGSKSSMESCLDGYAQARI